MSFAHSGDRIQGTPGIIIVIVCACRVLSGPEAGREQRSPNDCQPFPYAAVARAASATPKRCAADDASCHKPARCAPPPEPSGASGSVAAAGASAFPAAGCRTPTTICSRRRYLDQRRFFPAPTTSWSSGNSPTACRNNRAVVSCFCCSCGIARDLLRVFALCSIPA